MNRFIAFTESAADALVSSRFFQTLEYSQGEALIKLMKEGAENDFGRLSGDVSYLRFEGGVIISADLLSSETNLIVVDPDQSELFTHLDDNSLISVLQKILRFSKKLWQGLSRNYSERLIPDSSKAVLFPLSGYQPTPYRIVIERKPMNARLEKRGREGRFMLVYKASYETGDAQTERPQETNLRKLAENYTSAVEKFNSCFEGFKDEVLASAPAPLIAASIDTLSTQKSLFQPYDIWLDNITEKQRSFVTSGRKNAALIEGAAGTGKTLSLMLKAVFDLRQAAKDRVKFRALFVTHSDATKVAILEYLSVIDPDAFYSKNSDLNDVSIRVSTLTELCAEQLATQIKSSELIDRDALDSKEIQLLYISDALERSIDRDLPTHERYMSQTLLKFIQETDRWSITQMLQHEISILLKGRAGEDLDRYKKLPALRYGLPIDGDGDKGFIFSIFKVYQESLQSTGQFDTDDVVLTAIGQLEAPIWRRRRAREGFDHVYIDETHLFNINELHVFHYLPKTQNSFPFSYSIDRSQAVGDHGWTTDEISSTLSVEVDIDRKRLGTVFRSSPSIIDLASSVLASGATLFTNFENPMKDSFSGFTQDEERKSELPVYRSYPNDDAMIEGAFTRAEVLIEELGCRKAQVAIIAFDVDLLKKLEEFARVKNKPSIILNRRGDISAVEHADLAGQFILGHADFVGGLEFLGVVLIGVDDGRLPPQHSQSGESKSYLSYVSHNRLYVAISRAKYRVELLGDSARGSSSLISAAVTKNFVTVM